MCLQELEEVPVSIVGAFDVHRRQLTFEYLDIESGELRNGRVAPADRAHLRAWLTRFAGRDDVAFAVEGCTGRRYVVEELPRAGVAPHLAEPADTAALRGRKRHANTDKADARHLRVHLMAGDLPESWIPPEHVLEARATVRLDKGASRSALRPHLAPSGLIAETKASAARVKGRASSGRQHQLGNRPAQPKPGKRTPGVRLILALRRERRRVTTLSRVIGHAAGSEIFREDACRGRV